MSIQGFLLKLHLSIKTLPQSQCLLQFPQSQLTVEVNLCPKRKKMKLKKPRDGPRKLTMARGVSQQFCLLDLLYLSADLHDSRYHLIETCSHLSFMFVEVIQHDSCPRKIVVGTGFGLKSYMKLIRTIFIKDERTPFCMMYIGVYRHAQPVPCPDIQKFAR